MTRPATAREKARTLAQLIRSDGCTLAPDFNFADACKLHDLHYRTHRDAHGEPIERDVADAILRAGIRKRAGRFFAWSYWIAVRIFGRIAWAKAAGRKLHCPACGLAGMVPLPPIVRHDWPIDCPGCGKRYSAPALAGSAFTMRCECAASFDVDLKARTVKLRPAPGTSCDPPPGTASANAPL